MKKIIAGTLLSFLVCTVQAQETDVLQLFACNFAEGKNVENLWETIDTLKSLDSGAASDEAAGSFIWLPFRSGMGYDYIWGILNSDLKSMARGEEAFVSSGNARIMGPRFAALGDCISSINLTEPIKTGVIGTGEDRNSDAVVETFTCNHINGADMDDVRKATDFWKTQIDKMGSAAFESYDAVLMLPFRGGSGDWDWAWIGASPNLMNFAETSEDYLASAGGAAADARFAAISRCKSALWQGYWINTPANRM
ncbi:MAG: hypothetical protein O6766_13700 [Gammaproteobacteria bacterium]|nr:hypothetical protein [Gammaproteobacteria bacterium]